MASIDWSEIRDIKTIIVSWCVSNTSSVQASITQVVNNMSFQPDLAIIRSIIFNTTKVIADGNMYIIWSDLTNDYIGTFGGVDNGIVGSPVIVTPNTTIMIKKPIDSLRFQLFQISNTNATLSQVVPLSSITSDYQSFLAITIDFIQVKNSHGRHLLHDQHSTR
jgi:hypothetical protein